MLVDLISVIAAFYLSAFTRGGIIYSGCMIDLYDNLFIVLILSSFIISNVSNNKNIFKRGFFEELICILKDQGKLGLILLGYVFAIQEGSYYSRIFFIVFFLYNILVTFVLRSYMKLIMLLAYKKSSSSNKVMLITEKQRNAADLIRRIRGEYEWDIYVSSIALMDQDCIGKKIEGIEVVANRSNLLDVVKLSVVDEVFICIPSQSNYGLESIILEMEKMGIIVHMHLNIFDNLNIKEKTVEEFAGYQVFTFASGLFDQRKAIIKRLFDILGGLLGCLLTLILTVFLAPVILIESPGPIFFSQIRIGKNGRKFKIYKFRSMYRDAEQRKAELMAKNEMSGFMFKMTDDPRITRIGRFIRKTSLDEFPQFFNVFKGDMSLVGTRPPTEDEFERYEARHRRRLCLKPGLTGLWQVSGRSDIDNFEEVVKLDLKYIDNWSFKLDVKLILKTIEVVVLGKGSK
jgi:exopolysaccharide biosynthesis polyprenyl glycosylphosphotransferase